MGDETISPKIRQVLQHWGYKLTKRDYDNEVKRRRKSGTTSTQKKGKRIQRRSKRRQGKKTKNRFSFF